MKKIRAILYDVDGTLLDFETQEEVALSYCFKKYNLGELSEEKLELYKRINLGYWEMFEKNLITKEKLVVKRFEDYLEALGVKLNAEEVNDTYFSKLGDTIVFKDNSYELVKSLKGKIKHGLSWEHASRRFPKILPPNWRMRATTTVMML